MITTLPFYFNSTVELLNVNKCLKSKDFSLCQDPGRTSKYSSMKSLKVSAPLRSKAIITLFSSSPVCFRLIH
jgi:hypothetical protein